jgi:hypothetical protein
MEVEGAGRSPGEQVPPRSWGTMNVTAVADAQSCQALIPVAASSRTPTPRRASPVESQRARPRPSTRLPPCTSHPRRRNPGCVCPAPKIPRCARLTWGSQLPRTSCSRSSLGKGPAGAPRGHAAQAVSRPRPHGAGSAGQPGQRVGHLDAACRSPRGRRGDHGSERVVALAPGRLGCTHRAAGSCMETPGAPAQRRSARLTAGSPRARARRGPARRGRHAVHAMPGRHATPPPSARRGRRSHHAPAYDRNAAASTASPGSAASAAS